MFHKAKAKYFSNGSSNYHHFVPLIIDIVVKLAFRRACNFWQ